MHRSVSLASCVGQVRRARAEFTCATVDLPSRSTRLLDQLNRNTQQPQAAGLGFLGLISEA